MLICTCSAVLCTKGGSVIYILKKENKNIEEMLNSSKNH